MQYLMCCQQRQEKYIKLQLACKMELSSLSFHAQPELTREKQQAMLISSYKRAVTLLYKQSTQQQGKSILMDIMTSPHINQPALKELKLCTLSSLAQLSKLQCEYFSALYYWHEVNKVESSFNIWIKMAQTLQQLRSTYISNPQSPHFINSKLSVCQIQQQIQYTYKNAIISSPSLWKQHLLTKLHTVYKTHNKPLEAKDLQSLVNNNEYNIIIQQQKQFNKIEPTDTNLTSLSPQNQNGIQDQQNFISQTQLDIHNFIGQENQLSQTLNLWDFILTYCNFVFNQTKNYINSKKYAKKHEEALQSLGKINIYKTKIIVKSRSLSKGDSQTSKMVAEAEDDQKEGIRQNGKNQEIDKQHKKINGQMEIQLTNKEIVFQNLNIQQLQAKRQLQQQKKIQYQPQSPSLLDKINNLIIDNYKDLTRDPYGSSQPKSKKSQNSVNASNRNIFQSLYDYFREMSIAKGIDLKLFQALKYIDPTQNPIFQYDNVESKNMKTLFANIIQPLITGIQRISKQKQKQLGNNITQSRLLNQQQPSNINNSINTRERRSALVNNSSLPQIFISSLTPSKQKDSNKIQFELLTKIRLQFGQWILSQQTHIFSKMLYLAEKVICKIIQIYENLGIMEIPDCSSEYNFGNDNINGSNTSSGRACMIDHQMFQSTNKLIALCFSKCIQHINNPQQMFNAVSNCNDNTITITQFYSKIRIINHIILKYIQQQSNITNKAQIANLCLYLMNRCQQRIDQIIYIKSKENKPNNGNIKGYSHQELVELLEMVHICVMLSSSGMSVDEKKIKHFMNYYSAFHKQYQSMQIAKELQESEDWSQMQLQLKPMYLRNKLNLPSPQKLKQQAQIRVGKSKLKELSQQQCQQSTLMNSIDKFFKSDLKTTQTLQSLKSVINGNQGVGIPFYLLSFCKIVQLLISNLQTANAINQKYVQNSIKLMEIPMHIEVLHKKLTEDKKGDKKEKVQSFENQQSNKSNHNLLNLTSDYRSRIATMFSLLKVHLLNELDPQHSSLCLRIVFYLLQDALKTINQIHYLANPQSTQSIHYSHQQQICKIIILFDQLIKTKSNSDLLKKFYHRILIKNIRYIYDHYSHHSRAQHPNDTRFQIYKIFNQTFHNKIFKPKKMEDCLGYFLMISRQFAFEFDKPEVQFQQKMKKVVNQCYLIFKDNFSKQFKFCDRFIRAMEYFVCVVRKRIQQSEEFVNYFTGKQIICDCCQGPYLLGNTRKQPFAKEVLFVVAKYLQNRKRQQKNNGTAPSNNIYKQNQCQSKQKFIGNSKEEKKKILNFIQFQSDDEKYYLYYLLLALNSGKAWYEMLRFQISKVYTYFDCLVGPQFYEQTQQSLALSQQPLPIQENNILQTYKHKFKYAKTIGSFIIRHLSSSQFDDARQYALYRIQIVNSLKIGQRKLNKKLSQLQRIPQFIKLHTIKYFQGIITVLLRRQQSQRPEEEQQFSIGNKLLQINYLIYVQFKLPLLIHNYQNEQFNGNIYTFKKVLEQGFMLLKQIKYKMKSKNGQMVDESLENYQKIYQSKFSIKHMEMSLKVEIISVVCKLILDSLQYVERQAISIKSQSQMISQRRLEIPKKWKIERQTEVQKSNEDQLYVKKMQSLAQISTSLSEIVDEFETWLPKQESGEQEKSMSEALCSLQQKSDKQQNKIEIINKYYFPDYLTALSDIEHKIELFPRILEHISKYNLSNRIKKQNFARYIFLANLWLSKIYHQFNKRQLALLYAKQLANLKNDEIVNFYHHYENEPTQQNQILAEFYSRDIVFYYTKVQAIEHLLKLYSKSDTLDTSIMIIRKLGKLYIHKIQKSDNQKEKDSKGKEDEGKKTENKGKDKKGEEAQKNEMRDQKEPKNALCEIDRQKNGDKQKSKKAKKQGKDSKEKVSKQTKSEKKIKWLFILFLKGVQIYLQAVTELLDAKNQAIDQKFQKALIQFKNKIKKQVEKQKKCPTNQIGISERKYAAMVMTSLQDFIAYYENKFGKKIRMKAPKKPKLDDILQLQAIFIQPTEDLKKEKQQALLFHLHPNNEELQNEHHILKQVIEGNKPNEEQQNQGEDEDEQNQSQKDNPEIGQQQALQQRINIQKQEWPQGNYILADEIQNSQLKMEEEGQDQQQDDSQNP